MLSLHLNLLGYGGRGFAELGPLDAQAGPASIGSRRHARRAQTRARMAGIDLVNSIASRVPNLSLRTG